MMPPTAGRISHMKPGEGITEQSRLSDSTRARQNERARPPHLGVKLPVNGEGVHLPNRLKRPIQSSCNRCATPALTGSAQRASSFAVDPSDGPTAGRIYLLASVNPDLLT